MTRKRGARLIGVLSLIYLVGVTAWAQAPQVSAPAACSLSWVGHETEIEEFLRTAPVPKMEDVPIGVTKPRRAVFAPGSLVRRAAWKALMPSYRSGFHESYKAELAAYDLDRLLELHMVPPTVERNLDGRVGAMIYWIENTHPWDAKTTPRGPEPGWSKQLAKMKMFDLLTANIDRNAGNILYDDDWHLFLIDHSRALTDRKNLKGPAPLTRVDRDLWTRIEALDADSLQAALGDWLSPNEIKAMLVRRDLMRAEIAKLVAKNGEAAVFF